MESTDSSYNYPGSGIVRLTWQWELASGSRRIDVGSYVQSGLVAHFDGIRNAGADKPHDTAAAVWKNLGSNGIDAQVEAVPGDNSFWNEAGYWFSGSGRVCTAQAFDLGRRFAVQMVCDFEGWLQPALPGSSLVVPLCSENKYLSVYRWQTTQNDDITFDSDELIGKKNRASISPWSGEYLNVSIDYDKNALFQTVVPNTWKTGDRTSSTFVPLGSTKYYWGRGPGKISSPDYSRGIVYAVRFYDRLLTDRQYVRNRMIDDIRYHASYPDNGVVAVRSEIGGDGAELAVGDYEVAGETTYSVPEKITVNGMEYSSRGYRLESWDAATSNWVSGVELGGRSCTIPSGATKKITWLWTMTKGIKSGYTVDDYVQNGLVLHVDGICNAGREVPHKSDAAFNIWQDLTEKRNTFIYAVNQPGTNEVYDMTGEGWSDNGFTFVGKYRSVLSIPFTPGSNTTVETVLDFNKVNMIGGISWPTLWAISADNGVFFRMSQDIIEFKVDGYVNIGSGDRSKVPIRGARFNWNTAMITPDQTYVFSGSEISGASKSDQLMPKVISAAKWSLGGANYLGNLYNKDKFENDLGNLSVRATCAKYHAFRVYNRPLSSEEIAHNQMVDRARFFGGGIAVTNVVVATLQEGVEGVEKSGAYTVKGEWDFTAREVTLSDGDSEVLWRPVGYYHETLENGEWKNRTYRPGTAYRHRENADSVPVRITWRWREGLANRMILIVR